MRMTFVAGLILAAARLPAPGWSVARAKRAGENPELKASVTL